MLSGQIEIYRAVPKSPPPAVKVQEPQRKVEPPKVSQLLRQDVHADRVPE